MKIGLIGTGELGKAIGANMLKAGHDLVVHDWRKEAADGLLEKGASWAGSPQELAASAEVVLTALPTPAIVESVLTAPDGVLAGLSLGKAWIDHSTNDGDVLEAIARQAAKNGIDVVEAPVTGGIPLAHAGEITVLVGADPDVYQKYLPLLQVVGDPVIHLGPLGSASVVKVITNMLAFVHLWALGEGLMLGRRAGLAAGPVFEAILASCADSFVARTEGPPILNGSYDYGFTLELANKDLRLVHGLADKFGVPLEMGGLVQEIFQRAEDRYGPGFWSTGVVRLMEDELATDLRAPGYSAEGRW